jgi:hypothetical protein
VGSYTRGSAAAPPETRSARRPRAPLRHLPHCGGPAVIKAVTAAPPLCTLRPRALGQLHARAAPVLALQRVRGARGPRALRSAVAGGALDVPLTDPAAAKVRTLAVAVILASSPDPMCVQREIAFAKIRARFAAALQEADESCLAAGRPFSLRAWLRMASQKKCGAVFARIA